MIMGNAVRLVLRFRARFWEALTIPDDEENPVSLADAAFIHYPGEPLPTWWTQLPIRTPILVCWAGGPKADSLVRSHNQTTRESDEYKGRYNARSPLALDSFVLEQAISSLSRILNTKVEYLRGQLAASYFHNWQADPLSRGAYSYVPVGGLDAQRIVSQPLADKIFFAGEATSVGHVGTVHGAVQSGQRAAKQILASADNLPSVER
jgi:monoamine oxidase